MKTIYEICDHQDEGYIRVTQQQTKPGYITLTMGLKNEDWLHIELSLAEFYELCNIRYKLMFESGPLTPLLAQESQHA